MFGFTNSQQRAYDLMCTGKNIFLSGEAGTGKSYVVQKFISHHSSVMVCAPTGVAAINVHGSTLHRAFKAPIGVIGPTEYLKSVPKYLKKARILIIDEISMCRRDLFEYVMRTIDKNKLKIQVIVVGDFFQLPPVTTDRDKEVIYQLYPDGIFPYNSSYWKFENAVLLENCRQSDEDFLMSLNKLRVGDYSGITYFNSRVRARGKDDICLCATNAMVDKINREELEKLRAPACEFVTESEGVVKKGDMCVPDTLILKEGCRVMSVLNGDNYVNGSLGTVESIDDESIWVEFDSGERAEICKADFEVLAYDTDGEKVVTTVIGTYTQFPLKVAYAITIHKSQGQTYDHAHVYPRCFEQGQLYVALSRVRTPEGLSLEYPIT